MRPVRHPRARRRQRGITILETLVGLTLTTIVLAGIHASQRAQAYALQANNAAFELQDVAKAALDIMVREVRMAGYDPSGAALAMSPGPACPGVSQGIVEATPTRIHVRADLDGDGATTGPNEDVVYELDLALHRIVRIDDQGTVSLIDDVPNDALAFRYFDTTDPPGELFGSPGLSASDRDCVGSVAVVVRVQAENPDPRTSSTLSTEASSQVAIRSRSLTNF
jgi:type IV pilus assembly protein PilW